jgi:class 3 adenylate cyclase/PAS domain-containing protein
MKIYFRRLLSIFILLSLLGLLSFYASLHFREKETENNIHAQEFQWIGEKLFSSSEKLSFLSISYIYGLDGSFETEYALEKEEYEIERTAFRRISSSGFDEGLNTINKILSLQDELRKIEKESFAEARLVPNKKDNSFYINKDYHTKTKEMNTLYNELSKSYQEINSLNQQTLRKRSFLSFIAMGIFILLNTFLVIFGILNYIQKRVILPIQALTRDVQLLADGTFVDVSHQNDESEFKDLARSIAQLFKNVQTERDLKKAEEERAMTAQEMIFDQFRFVSVLIDIIPYPIFYKNAETRFTGFNKAYENTFKVNRRDLIGKRVLDLEYLPMEDRILYQKEDEETIQNLAEVQKEMPIPFADGKIHQTLYWIKGFKKNDGSPGGLVGTFIDISQQKEIERLYGEIQVEKAKSDKLLLNILPEKVANELKEKGIVTPVYYEEVSILFTDFKGFTQIAQKMTPQDLIKELDSCFSQFDRIAEKYKLEKLKTIGDSYMCASGLYNDKKVHAINIALAGIEIKNLMNQVKIVKESLGIPYWELRIGIHSGPVMAGVVGEKKFAYDVWGDTVNTASRMESSGSPGKVNISDTTYDLIKEYFDFTYRGEVDAKNKGKIKMYFIERIKPEYSQDKNGLVPKDNLFHVI